MADRTPCPTCGDMGLCRACQAVLPPPAEGLHLERPRGAAVSVLVCTKGHRTEVSTAETRRNPPRECPACAELKALVRERRDRCDVRELGKLPASPAGALRVARTWWAHREAFVGAGLVEEGEAVVFAALRTRGVADVETFLTEAKDAPTARKSLARTRRPEGGILVQAVGS